LYKIFNKVNLHDTIFQKMRNSNMKLDILRNVIPKVLIATVLVVFSAQELSARRYNPKQTKKRAIEMIERNSVEVSEIAGLDPKVGEKFIDENDGEEDSELLSDSELDSTEALELQKMEQEDEKYKDVDININNFQSQWLSYVSAGEISPFTEGGFSKEELMQTIMNWLGTPYRFGSSSRKSIDCSAFTQTMYEQAVEVRLPRTANNQYSVGEKIEKFEDLQFGDLVFFHTRRYARATHVGIYLGDNLFAHASSRYGVTVSSLESGYYHKRFIGGRRLTYEDIMQMSLNKEDDEQSDAKYGG
jgi:hypothetical protein